MVGAGILVPMHSRETVIAILELPLGEGDGSGLVDPADVPPEVQAVLREYQRQYEEAWIDMPILALDGMTPRDAMDDPTRREDVERVLAAMAPDSGDLGMDPARIRTLLGRRSRPVHRPDDGAGRPDRHRDVPLAAVQGHRPRRRTRPRRAVNRRTTSATSRRR